MTVDAVGGPRKGLKPLRRDRFTARLANPKSAGLDTSQSALYLDQVSLFAFAKLLAALALGDFRGSRRLRAMGDSRVFDLLG